MSNDLLSKFEQELNAANTTQEIEELKINWLGKKGPIADMMKQMKDLDHEQRRQLGQESNILKQKVSASINEKLTLKKEEERAAKLASETVDVTLVSKQANVGTFHPLDIVVRKATNFFSNLSYQIESGNEVETDEYNFERLNIDKDHPARDMQDTFFIDKNNLLRTHCTAVTSRIIEKHNEGPVRVIAHGPVFRRDDDDATHSHQFYQIDGVNIDKNISIANLKWTLLEFLKSIFGEETEIRMRPSFFPFTEPSYEVDLKCVKCGGEGCNVCSHSGWIEILGCGMLHPNVIKSNGLDPEKYQGFAFGIGVERIAMLKFGIEDIRRFYNNDFRFLKQFKVGE